MSVSDNLILLDTYVQDFWEKKDRRLSRILKVMDNVEFWVAEDEEAFAQGINRIGRYISDTDSSKIEAVIDNLIIIIAYMSSSKAMRLLGWLEEHHPDVFQKMMASLPNHDKPKAAKLLSTRLRVVQSLDLINKVFNPSRSQRISSWLKTHVSQDAES